MKDYIRKKAIILGIFVVVSLVMESVVFLMNFGELPKYVLFDVSFLFYFCAALILIGGPITEIVISNIFLTGQLVICFVNANMIGVTGEIFSWDMLSLLSEAAEVLGRSFIVNYACIIVFICIQALGLFAMIKVVIKKNDDASEINHVHLWKVRLESLLTCILLGIGLNNIQVSNLSVYSKTLKTGNDLYLYETLYIKQEAYRKFGTFGYYCMDAKKTLFDNLSSGSKENTKKQLTEYFDDASDTTNSLTGISEGNNVIFILYETGEWLGINKQLTPNMYGLLTGTTDKDGNTLDEAVLLTQYYAKSQTNISEAQMLFGSYPLKGILNFDYTKNAYPFTLPNMYRSAYPNSSIVSYHNNYGNYYDRVNSHLHYGFDEHVDASQMDLRKGNSTWINMDSEMFESCITSSEKYTNCTPIVPDDGKQFLRFIASFSTHGPFDYRVEYEEKGYYELVENYIQSQESLTTIHGDEIDFTGEKYAINGLSSVANYKQYIRTYLAATHDFDKGLGLMIDDLREKDLLESTTIVVMADHYAYYHWLSNFTKGYEEGLMTEADIFNVPAFIFDTKLSAALKEEAELSSTVKTGKLENDRNLSYKTYLGDQLLCYDKFITNPDSTPTLLNLLGIPYNERYYMGYDAFGEKDSMLFSRWGGYFNNSFYSNDGITALNLPEEYEYYYDLETSGNDEFEEIDGMTYNEYLDIKDKLTIFRQNASDFLERIDMINKMYKCDYFGD